MEVEFANDDLELLAKDASRSGGFAQAVVKKYRQRIQLIAASRDERDFYALKSLHYEKLKGTRSHQRSMKLNAQWRLILEIRESAEVHVVRIIEIADYH